MTTMREREDAAWAQCQLMTDEALRELLAAKRITKTLRRMAESQLRRREHERVCEILREKQDRMKRLGREALWQEIEAGNDFAREEWRRRETTAKRQATIDQKAAAKEKLQQDMHAFEHMTTEELLAYAPTADTFREECLAVIELLKQRQQRCAKKADQLLKASYRQPAEPKLVVVEPLEPQPIPMIKRVG